MIARTVTQIVAVVGFAAALVMGCAVAPADAESTGASSDALVKCSADGTCPHTVTITTCGATTSFKSDSPFEQALYDLGCSGKQAYSKASTNTTGWFNAACPQNTTATFKCPIANPSNPPSLTGGVWLATFCYSQVAPVYAAEVDTNNCTHQASDANTQIVGWDPNCSGSGCAQTSRILID